MRRKADIEKIAYIGNYSPRKCGIATFTTDLCTSIHREYPRIDCLVMPINDIPEGYDYPKEVRYEIDEQDLNSYLRAADFLNVSEASVLCVEHEFGIFGGEAGSHLLALLHAVNMPIVTTLHTILETPNPDQRLVMLEIIALSVRLIVMTAKGRELLMRVYAVPDEKICVIPHGIPDIPFAESEYFKEEFGLEGKHVILTFGLLSPNKGTEYALDAMPMILAAYHDTVFVVVGQTHPHLLEKDGELYRLSLEQRATSLGIEEHIVFFNRFVELDELTRFLGATDIYLTPYLTETQITSGTLAFAFGTGNAVISTPYWHAAELLADRKGLLVPFRDSRAIANAAIELFGNPVLRNTMRKNAYAIGREMVWSAVAHQYMDVFKTAATIKNCDSPSTVHISTLDKAPSLLPVLKLDHLYNMSDSAGIFQHALYTVPDFNHGYCTDDNARAFLLTLLLQRSGRNTEKSDHLAAVYAAFLHYAFDQNTGRFRNFMTFNRSWIEDPGSEDCHGQALWALGMCMGHVCHRQYQALAAQLLERALPVVSSFQSPRAWAFALIGINEYLHLFTGDRRTEQIRETLIQKLIQRYKDASSPDWQWFEDSVTYANAKLSHALIASGRETGNTEAIDIGLKTLSWLLSVQISDKGIFQAIGSNGFFKKGKEKAHYDQQPIEAQALVSACLEAFRCTADMHWVNQARIVFAWFLGRNDVGLPLYDPETGGCRDGLHVDRLSQNQGAESTLAFLLSLEEMYLLKGKLTSFKQAEKGRTTL